MYIHALIKDAHCGRLFQISAMPRLDLGFSRIARLTCEGPKNSKLLLTIWVEPSNFAFLASGSVAIHRKNM